MNSALERLGFEVVCCADGTSAWEQMQKEPYPDVVILDWHMPGYTGLELCQMQQRSGLPFTYKIVLSGIANKEQLVEALHSGAHDVILKPIDMGQIESRLKVGLRFVEERRAGEEAIEVMNIYAQHMEELAKERAKQLVHAERMSSLGVMSAGVAHEINNPMSFISGNVQSLRRFWSDIEPALKACSSDDPVQARKIAFVAEEMPKVLEGIMKGVERVTTIVQSLKKYSGKDDGQKAEMDVNDSIRQALEFVRYSLGKNVKTEVQLADQPLIVSGSALELEQVLVNLFVNANQAMENVSSALLAITSRLTDKGVEIAVEDSGTGIPEELLEKIWNPFFTTKAPGKGTGLGLSISAGIVRRHGGTFIAENREGGGARFILRFPLSNSEGR